MTDPSPALQALIAALNARGEGDTVPRAFTGDGVVFRQGWGDRFGQVDERFDGHAEIAAWMLRSPPTTHFSLASEPSLTPEGWTVRYRVGVQTFENHGSWRLHLDGPRVAALWHQPDNLSVPGQAPRSGHDHDHDHP